MKITGRATVHGSDGMTVGYTGAAAISQTNVDTATITNAADKNEVKDGNGEIISEAYTNIRDEITIDLIPVAPTGTNTLTEAKRLNELPPIPSAVTLAGFPIAAYNTGTWLYKGGGSIAYGGGNVRMTLPLIRHKDTPGGVNLAAAVA